MPPDATDEEMFLDFKRELHKRLKGGTLSDTAFMNGLRTLAKLVPPAAEVKDELDEFSLLERLPSLPKTHAKKLLKHEIVRLGSDLKAHESALAALEAPNEPDDHLGSSGA